MPSEKLDEVGSSGQGPGTISAIMRDWVGGCSIKDLATRYFRSKAKDETGAITDACKAIYGRLTNLAPWGLSALCQVSGVDFDQLSEEDRARVNILPAMVYHGVRTEAAVLMRMNGVPRSIAESLGTRFQDSDRGHDLGSGAAGSARQFLQQLSKPEWHRYRPSGAAMSGTDYQQVWRMLSGESEW